jgi:hypothetical protein
MSDRVCHVKLEFCPDHCCAFITIKTADKKPLTMAHILAGITNAQMELISNKVKGRIKLNWDESKSKLTIVKEPPPEGMH